MTESQINIIHLNQDRWKDYRQIYLEELKNEPVAFLNSYYKISKLPDSEWKKRLKERSKDIYFAEYKNKLVGMAGRTFGDTPKNKHTVSLWGVYVKSNFRRRGIARSLLTHIIFDLYKKPKVIKVSLGVIVTQKNAQTLYKSLEFKKVGYLKKEFYVNGKFYDEILMEKILR